MNRQPLIIIQARMGSSRLPGKSMMNIAGKPLLDYLVQTVFQVFKEAKLIIATSERVENNLIRNYARANGIDVISGSEENVASRFIEAILKFPQYEYFMRLCGDSPFFDIELLERGKKVLNDGNNYQFITSKFNEGFPMGSNLEIVDRALYLAKYEKFTKSEHFEHVTKYFYEDFEAYKSYVIKCAIHGFDEPKNKLSVDTSEDFMKAEFLLEKMNFTPWKFSLTEKFNFIHNYFEETLDSNNSKL